jgi:MFS family permease
MADITTGAPPITVGQRYWNLAAAIASVTAFGLGIGQGAPLLSLLLDSHGTDPTMNGLNAASAFIGVIVGPLLAPRGVRLFGLRNFLLLCIAVEVAICPLLKLFPGFVAWIILRAVSGLFGASIFTTSEAWINLLADDTSRGRVIGIYAAALAAGFGIGPLVLTLTGIQGWLPFLANAAIIATAALPLLGVRNLSGDFGTKPLSHPFAMFARAPLIVLAVGLFGLYEATLMALLPIWAVRLGFGTGLAAATLSAVFIGSVLLQWPIGLLSDRIDRRLMLRLCGVGGLLGAVVVAAIAAPAPRLLIVLAVWGGVTSAIYPVALSMAGDRFRGNELMTVNAAIIIAYGLGALMGPMLGGAAMDVWNPQGLLVYFILLFAGFCLATWVRAKPA